MESFIVKVKLPTGGVMTEAIDISSKTAKNILEKL